MDSPTSAIVGYAQQVCNEKSSSLPVREVIRHLIDSFACAFGALNSRPAKVARAIASSATCRHGASVFGVAEQTTPEYAAFANTAMIRFLDYNDTGIGGHPSDMLAAVLSLAETRGVSGMDVIRAVHAEYEVFAALRYGGLNGYTLRKKHVDQVLTILGGVVGASMILGLDAERMANAVSIAITPNIPMRVTRTGTISDWKGCATAHCAMVSVFAARLAEQGLTGPDQPFEGLAGFYQMIGVGPLNLDEIGQPRNGLAAVQRTGLKYYPADYNAHVALGILLTMRDQVHLNDIQEIKIYLHWGGWHSIGGGAGDPEEKWDPHTRESADHSMPYLAAIALMDGEITLESFTEERVRETALRPLMKMVSVFHDPELDREHAGELPTWPATVEILLKNGKRLRKHSSLPKGHPHKPLTDAELEEKYWRMSDRIQGRADGQRLLDMLWSVDRLQDIGELMQLIRQIPVQPFDSDRGVDNDEVIRKF